MPIDKMFSDAMLGTFRGMAQEMKDKNITGTDVDEMNNCLTRMEQLAEELSDLGEFNGLLMQENLMMRFSDHYGRALSNASKAQYQVSGTVYDEKTDQQLMNQTLNAYRDAIKRLEEAKKASVEYHGKKASDVFLNTDHLIKPIEDVIKLGESGLTYATFLRKMIEMGMDKAMEGSVCSRVAIVYIRDFYTAAKISPLYEEREEAHLKLFDELASNSKFKSPSLLKYNLGCERIDAGMEPKIKKWDAIKTAYENILETLSNWSMAHMSFAPTLEPWSMAENPRAAVKRDIECDPGKLEIQLIQLKKYFGMTFEDVFKHEVFVWDVNWQHLWYSQEYTTFMRYDVFPVCKPGNKLGAELISKMESIYKEHRMRNPDQNKINERYRINHNQYFGEGTYEAKHGVPQPYLCNAKSWDLTTF